MSQPGTAGRVAIKGSYRPPEAGYRRTGVKDLDEAIEVTVLVRPRTRLPSDEETYALGLTPLRQRRHTTLEEWNEKHGATERVLDAVEDYAVRHDLQVAGKSSALRRRVALTGTIRNMSKAFGTRLTHYEMSRNAASRLGESRTFLGREGELSVDDPRIAPLITSVLGLDARPLRQAPRGAPPGAVWSHSPPGIAAYSPREVASIYNFATAYEGNGQTIALIEMDSGYRKTKDMEPYFAGLGFDMPELVDVLVNGARNKYRGGQDNGEVALDLQVVGAIVPKATLVVYFTHGANPSNRDYVDTVSTALFEQAPSLGAPDELGLSESQWTTLEMEAMHATFKAAAWLGITVCAATGDSGYSDLYGMGDVRDKAVPPNVDYPASCPFVLACGGTSLQRKNGGIHEVVWVNTGGGFSNWFPVPSWQEAVDAYRARHPAKGPASGASGRGVPDVGGLADFNVGYRTHFAGRTHIVGGTSAVAPLWAAFVAQLNEDLAQTPGFPKTRGRDTSTRSCTGHRPGRVRALCEGTNGYPAGFGWDPMHRERKPRRGRLIAALKHRARRPRPTSPWSEVDKASSPFHDAPGKRMRSTVP